MTEFAVTAIGRDRPGIVAALSDVLLELGGNVEDSRMAILGGHFSVMLLVDLPESRSAAELEQGLAAVRERLGLEAVSANEVERLGQSAGEPTHVLTVYGADRPGIVHGVTRLLAERGVNVTDLSTRVAGGAQPVYVMVLELALGEVPQAELAGALGARAAELEVDVSLRELESVEL